MSAIEQDLAGKVVLITGAAQGIGAATALALVRRGATVVATDRVADAPEPAARAAEASGEFLYEQLDVTSDADWSRVIERIRTRFGRLDGLVNNVGLVLRERLEVADPESCERAFSVTVMGALRGIQASLPLMEAGGSVVNIGSIAALTPYHAVPYTLAKWALRALSKIASMELGPRGIRVNMVHPGFTETAGVATAGDAFRSLSLDQAPLGAAAAPDDIAAAVAFLLSDAARMVSGVDMSVDGGTVSHGGQKPVADGMREPAL